MVFRMGATLIIPDTVLGELKWHGTTMSELATELLRKGLAIRPKHRRLPPLPGFKMRPPKVDIADREALYDVLDAERDGWLSGKNKGR
jgi:hypothetical protein